MTASTRRIGSLSVSSLGLGAMPLSTGRGEPAPHDRAMATIHAALDAGITLLDTADIYAPSWDTMGHNEQLVGEALCSWGGDRSQVVVATKGGITRSALPGAPLAARRAGSAALVPRRRPVRRPRRAGGGAARAPPRGDAPTRARAPTAGPRRAARGAGERVCAVTRSSTPPLS